MNTKSSKQPIETNANKGLFRVMMIIFPIVLLIVIELILRLFSVGENVHLFINHPNKNYKAYYVVNPLIGKKYFNRFEATSGVSDIFLKDKPENAFRIFVLGSSSMVGFPYEKNLMATRILHKRLQDAYPDKRIEMVNTAITAINSITLDDYMNEIVKYKPDAILIYAGHNEFYGAMGIGSNETMSRNRTIRNIHFKLMNFRLYQLLRGGITKFTDKINHVPNVAESKGSLMKRIVANPEIEYKSSTYNQGINQFRQNMGDILDKASSRNIPVFISNLVCNFKDIQPLGKTDEGYKAYNDALVKLQMNDSVAARELFYKAKDLDPVRFRASEDINLIIDSLANAYKCFYIDAKSKFEAASPKGIVGNNLMTEHLHPNIEGQFLLADAFYQKIIESHLIISEPSTNEIHPAYYYRLHWGYTELDSLIGEFRVKQLKSYWPFTSLDNSITFRETYRPKTIIDSLAYTVLLSNNPEVEKLHEFLAKEYLSKNDYQKAVIEYKSMVNINPYWSEYTNQASNCYLKMNDLAAAEHFLNQSLMYRNTYYACFMMAEIKMIQHDFKTAVNFYELALNLASTADEENNILKKLYLAYYYNNQPDKQGKIAEKLKKANIAVENPGLVLAFTYSTYIPANIAGLMKEISGNIERKQIDSAIYNLNKALLINDAPVANKMMGDILFQKKDKRLLFFYQKAYQAYSYDPKFLHGYCVANIVNGQFGIAKETLTRIKQIDATYAEIPVLEKLLQGK